MHAINGDMVAFSRHIPNIEVGLCVTHGEGFKLHLIRFHSRTSRFVLALPDLLLI